MTRIFKDLDGQCFEDTGKNVYDCKIRNPGHHSSRCKIDFFSLLRNPPSEWEKSPVPLKVRVLLQDQLLTWLCYVEPSSWLHVKSVLLYTTSSRNSRQLENHSRKRPRQHKATLQKHPKSFPLNKPSKKSKWYFGLKSK